MFRRPSVDFVSWSLYRRAWIVPALALLLVLATSFRPDGSSTSTLPPTMNDERAAELLADARAFDKTFPDRRVGSPGGVDSAQWMSDAFGDLSIQARTVPATSTNPATGRPVGIINVEAALPGRTRETVVLYAHRDTAANGGGANAIGQVALLALAKELAATQDRRRSYLFVSTDAATLNGAGARALADRLATRRGIVAVIGLDRLSAAGELRVEASPSGRYAAPLGLVLNARDAVRAEQEVVTQPSALTQLVQLAAPLTLHEHGQLLSRGLPALTFSSGDDQLRDKARTGEQATQVAVALRSVQRLVANLDQIDQLQSAGKTWTASSQRVYRGWALKLFVASLLIPVWITAVDMLIRHRRGWNLPQAIGTMARAAMAGIFSVSALWLLGAMGLLPRSGDRPPNPGTLDNVDWIGLLLWLLLTSGAWLLARGPDWRRPSALQRRGVITLDRDMPELVLTLIALIALSAAVLAISPYSVLIAAPSLHLWLWLMSRRMHTQLYRTLAWSAGLAGPVLALALVAQRANTTLGTGWYALQLVQTRTIPATLGLILAVGLSWALLLLIAARGNVAAPAIVQLRPRIARASARTRALAHRIRAGFDTTTHSPTARSHRHARTGATATDSLRHRAPRASGMTPDDPQASHNATIERRRRSRRRITSSRRG